MIFSELINYRNELNKLNLHSMEKTMEEELKKVLYLAGQQPVLIGDLNSQLQTQEQQIYSSVGKFKNLMASLSQELDQLINELEKPYFVESYRLYDQEMNNETLDDIKNRTTNPPESTLTFYQNRISRYVGWQHSAMVIRPGFETFINDIVSCDPLYLVDLNHDLLVPSITQYNELYQQRLRSYVVSERNQNQILGRLPDNQYGIVLAYNYFNFRPFEIIRQWLTEILQKLKPGGTLLMTFNDCDRDKAVMLTEKHYCCYTPGRLVIQLAETLGYEVVFQWHDNGPSTWLELKRPGTLATLRGGQTLAKILPKSIAESK
jgi:hypothetical protein